VRGLDFLRRRRRIRWCEAVEVIGRGSIVGVVAVGVLAVDFPRAAVRDTPALRGSTARPLALPVPGRLLVEAPPFGSAIVEHDGRVVRLGDWYDAAWSPDGARVAATEGRSLAVLDETGTVGWIEPRPASAPPTQPDWAPDGRRLAYRGGQSLRVITADGRRDHAVANGLRFAGPRWRPRTFGQLAWADRHGAVRVLDITSARTRWTSPPGPSVRPDGLHWSPDGRTLAAISGSTVRIFDARHGALLRRLPTSRRNHFQFGVFAGDRLVLVRHDFTRGTSRVTRIEARDPRAVERTVFAGRGSVLDVTPSPDARRLLLGRRSRDEWQFSPLSAPASSLSIHGVTRRLNPQATGTWAFPTVRGWRTQRSR
jgi:WD40 repeat protein